MAIPDYQSLMHPVVTTVADGAVYRARELREQLAEQLAITSDERAELLPSGRQRTFDSRVSWACTYLVQAGLLTRPARGCIQLTDVGHRALAEHPRIDNGVLARYPSFQDFRRRVRSTSTGSETDEEPVGASGTTSVEVTGGAGRCAQEGGEASSSAGVVESTPAELIGAALQNNQAVVEAELLDHVMALTPTAFEDLVIRLLEAMGYGRAGMVERTSATGDAGVDGIISQDPLGLDRIYVQAKRYGADNPVTRPRIQEFAGALMGKQGDRGVFITTSRFTTGAVQEAERIASRIELIDGQRLMRLLVRYGVGVQAEETVVLYRVDEDFFETL